MSQIRRGKNEEDWCIRFAFESEEKRDRVLNVLGDDYSKYNLSLDDDSIDAENITIKYYAEVWCEDMLFEKRNSIEHNFDRPKLTISICDGELLDIDIEVSKEDFISKNKDKLRKIWHDYESNIKYMSSVECMTDEEIEASFNG